MSHRDLYAAFMENPEYLLALMLSTPSAAPSNPPSSVTVDFHGDEVIAKVARPQPQTPAPRILATKQTIYAAILLLHLINERGSDFAESLVGRAAAFGDRAARASAVLDLHAGAIWDDFSEEEKPNFLEELEISPGDIEVSQRKTNDALEFLEREGLAIDPAFTPEFMILAGLVPMHFSVRTPKGERVHREIIVNAPLWSLEVTRGTRGKRSYTDFEFKIRGIEVVRKAITAMATHYLESEEGIRRARGQPVLPRRASPKLDPEDDA